MIMTAGLGFKLDHLDDALTARSPGLWFEVHAENYLAQDLLNHLQWMRLIDSMAAQGGAAMSDLIWLSEAQMRRIEPYFPLSHGVPRVDDRRVISGIIFVIRNGLRWRDAPKDYGPHKTIVSAHPL